MRCHTLYKTKIIKIVFSYYNFIYIGFVIITQSRKYNQYFYIFIQYENL